MTQSKHTYDVLTRQPAHMGQPIGWSGCLYGANEPTQGYEHATQTPLKGEDGEKDYHEWHYAHLISEEGNIIVIGFITKQLFRASLGPTPISPGISIDCFMYDGTEIGMLKYYKHYSASHEKLDVQIGDSWIRAVDDNADTIHMHVRSGDIEINVELNRTVPAFRSETGKTIFGDGTKWEAWDIVQPAATMQGDITIKGDKRQIRGKAYVDHSYGNEMFGVHHWYWTPVEIGPYTFVVAATFVANRHLLGDKRDCLIAYMMAKGGKTLGRDPSKAQFLPGPKHYIPEMHRHVANEFKYRYQDGNMEYLLSLKQKTLLCIKPLLAMMVKNRLIGQLAQKFAIGGPYLRATYDAWLEVWENGEPVEKYGPDDCDGQVVGEIFYPGKNDPIDYSITR